MKNIRPVGQFIPALLIIALEFANLCEARRFIRQAPEQRVRFNDVPQFENGPPHKWDPNAKPVRGILRKPNAANNPQKGVRNNSVSGPQAQPRPAIWQPQLRTPLPSSPWVAHQPAAGQFFPNGLNPQAQEANFWVPANRLQQMQRRISPITLSKEQQENLQSQFLKMYKNTLLGQFEAQKQEQQRQRQKTPPPPQKQNPQIPPWGNAPIWLQNQNRQWHQPMTPFPVLANQQPMNLRQPPPLPLHFLAQQMPRPTSLIPQWPAAQAMPNPASNVVQMNPHFGTFHAPRAPFFNPMVRRIITQIRLTPFL